MPFCPFCKCRIKKGSFETTINIIYILSDMFFYNNHKNSQLLFFFSMELALRSLRTISPNQLLADQLSRPERQVRKCRYPPDQQPVIPVGDYYGLMLGSTLMKSTRTVARERYNCVQLCILSASPHRICNLQQADQPRTPAIAHAQYQSI